MSNPNTSGLPSYTEQDTKKLIAETIATSNIRRIEREKELKKIKSILYGKGKK